MSRAATITLLCCCAYAVVRYVIIGDTPVRHLPAYVINKGLAMGAVACMLGSAVAALRKDTVAAKVWGRYAFYSGVAHGFITMAIASPEYYERFYHDGKLTWAGECVILFGGIAAAAFWRAHHLAREGSPGKSALLACAILSLLHTAFMGVAQWSLDSLFRWVIPPISLMSFLGALAAVFAYARWRPHS